MIASFPVQAYHTLNSRFKFLSDAGLVCDHPFLSSFLFSSFLFPSPLFFRAKANFNTGSLKETAYIRPTQAYHCLSGKRLSSTRELTSCCHFLFLLPIPSSPLFVSFIFSHPNCFTFFFFFWITGAGASIFQREASAQVS